MVCLTHRAPPQHLGSISRIHRQQQLEHTPVEHSPSPRLPTINLWSAPLREGLVMSRCGFVIAPLDAGARLAAHDKAKRRKFLERTTGFEPATLTLASRPDAAEHRTEPWKSGLLRTFDLPNSPVDCRWLRLLGIVCRTNDGRNRMRTIPIRADHLRHENPDRCGLPQRTVSPRRGDPQLFRVSDCR
jgi:hypothetical protein